MTRLMDSIGSENERRLLQSVIDELLDLSDDRRRVILDSILELRWALQNEEDPEQWLNLVGRFVKEYNIDVRHATDKMDQRHRRRLARETRRRQLALFTITEADGRLD